MALAPTNTISGPGVVGRLAQSVNTKPGDWVKLANNFIKFAGLTTTSRRRAAACASSQRRLSVVAGVIDATRFPHAVWNFMGTVSRLGNQESKFGVALGLADGAASVTDASVKVMKAGDAIRAFRLQNRDQWTVAGNVAGAWMCARGARTSADGLYKEFTKEKVEEKDRPQVDLTSTKIFSNLLGLIKNVSRLALNVISFLGVTFSLVVPSLPMLVLSTLGLVTALGQGIMKEEIKGYQQNKPYLLIPKSVVDSN